MINKILGGRIRKQSLQLSLIILSAIVSPAFGQSNRNKTDSTPLPLDQAVRTGKLANGFTYYIRKNDYPKNRLSLQLANKLGSILEDDDQLGLAHFMEHMNFNGTVNFPEHELVDYLQKIGVRFGADLNASTDFNSTVYQLPIPSDKTELVDKGLVIMRDWCQGALLKDKDINEERGIILEEKRVRNNVSERFQMQYFPVLLNHSKYARRWPIGTEEVLKNFDPKVLRRFFKDWYRPNLQALIVVGDIDVNEMEKKIKTQFSDLKNPTDERSANPDKIILDGKNQFAVVTDREASGTSINVMTKFPELVLKSLNDYKTGYMQQLFNQMANERFREASLKENPDFINAGTSVQRFLGHLDTYSTYVDLKPEEYERGFKELWRLREIIKRFGFTPGELDRAKKQLLNEMENSLAENKKTSSASYAAEYVRVFLTGETSPGIQRETEILREILQKLTLEEMNKFIGSLMVAKNRDIIITSSTQNKNKLPNEATVNGWITTVEREKLAPYVEKGNHSALMKTIPAPVKIEQEKAIPSLGMTEMKLRNGVTVLLKPTDFKNGQIVFNAFSSGGTSVYSTQDFESANNVVDIIAAAGVGDFTATDADRITTSNMIGISPNMDEYYEGIQGSMKPASLVLGMQLIHLYLTNPRKDTIHFKNYLDRLTASISEQSNDPMKPFNDELIRAYHNDNPRFAPLSLQKINNMNLQRSYEIYKERFGNAKGMTILFVGNFKVEEMRPLIETYIATLPATPEKAAAKNINVEPLKGKYTRKIYSGNQEKSVVTLLFSGRSEYNPAQNLELKAITSILEYKLVERLRELESGVYSPNVSINKKKNPVENFSIFINFTCDPGNTDKLIAATLEEIEKLKTEGPSASDIAKYKQEGIRQDEIMLKENYYWLSFLTNAYKNDISPEYILSNSNMLQNLSLEKLKAAAQKYFDEDNLGQFILFPERMKVKDSNR